MSKVDDVLNSVIQVVQQTNNQLTIKKDDRIMDIMDSMSALEVLLIIEECGYSTTHLFVGDILPMTIEQLADTLGEKH